MISRQERETILRISDADQSWEVFTESPAFIRKLQKQGYSGRKDGAGVRYTITRRAISLRKPKKAMSEQERARFRERFKPAVEPVAD